MRRLTCLLLVCLSNLALADAVYKWTDSQGVVHYGDRPPANQNAESMHIDPAPDFVPRSQATGDAAPPGGDKPRSPRIVMYSRSDCGYCKKARQYFSRNGIAYRERDIQRSKQSYARWKRLGGSGVPVFEINGKVSHGFSEAGMTARLQAAKR